MSTHQTVTMATEEQRDLIDEFRETFPTAYTVEDTMRLCFQLSTEVERLRSVIGRIEQAIVDEGKMPPYHRAVMKRHRMEWGTLHNAIDKAIEALHE